MSYDKSTLFMQRTQHLLRSTILVIVIFGLNKITGFVKLLLMTATFGAGAQADAFTAANQLPELFDSMLAGGTLAAALIPVYLAYLTTGKQSDADAGKRVLTLTMLGLGGISGLAALFALPLSADLSGAGFCARTSRRSQQTLAMSVAA